MARNPIWKVGRGRFIRKFQRAYRPLALHLSINGTTAMTTVRQLRAIMNAVDRDAIADHFHQEEGDDSDREPFVVCGDVSVEVFNAYVGDGEGLPIGVRFLELSKDGCVLVVDVASLVHEATVCRFEWAFMNASGNDRAISPTGSMTAQQGGKPKKEADATYGPMPRTPNRTPPPRDRTLDDWITVAVEVGRSQTWPSLENAARWWYGYDGVQYVLLIKISPRGKRLDYRLYDVVAVPLQVNGALPVVDTVHIHGANGPAANVAFNTRRILSIPPGLGLPAGMPDQTVVDMQAVRDIVAETLWYPRV